MTMSNLQLKFSGCVATSDEHEYTVWIGIESKAAVRLPYN